MDAEYPWICDNCKREIPPGVGHSCSRVSIQREDSRDTLKTPKQAIDLMILSLGNPLLRPIEVMQLLDALSDENKTRFLRASTNIGTGLRLLREIREGIAKGETAETHDNQFTKPTP